MLGVLLTACTHQLEIANLSTYAVPVTVSHSDPAPKIAVTPWSSSSPDGLFFYNALVAALGQDSAQGKVSTDYVANLPGSVTPDLVVSIKPDVTYRTSGWNFLINWPGFILFVPAWNGYVYHADILTQVDVMDPTGHLLTRSMIPMSYSIREAEFDRTVWMGLGWIVFYSAPALAGGIYDASVFDRDIVPEFEMHAKDNYTAYVLHDLSPKLDEATAKLRQAAAVAASAPAQPPAPEGQPPEVSAPPVASPAPSTAEPAPTENR